MEVALSGKQMLKLLDNKSNLIQYKDVEKYDNIDTLLGEYKKCILLYHTSQSFGHWCALYRVGKTVYFFDSYGVMIDDQLI